MNLDDGSDCGSDHQLTLVARWSASMRSQTRARGWRIPAGDPTGIRAFNVKLAQGSDGLSPMIHDPSELEVATVRCSHTTATHRIINGAARAVNEEYADDRGRISAARIVERQPSFAEPLERGLLFNVIAGELVIQCPDLMGLMATSGNSDHGTARVATTVQRLKRVMSTAVKQKSLDTAADWDVVEKLSGVAMPQEFRKTLPSYAIGFRRATVAPATTTATTDGGVECRGHRSRSTHAWGWVDRHAGDGGGALTLGAGWRGWTKGVVGRWRGAPARAIPDVAGRGGYQFRQGVERWSRWKVSGGVWGVRAIADVEALDLPRRSASDVPAEVRRGASFRVRHGGGAAERTPQVCDHDGGIHTVVCW